jgi:cytochrome d ubiquinol oxidase subunit I
VAASLIAFVIDYFGGFGIGTWFILKLMGHEPHPGEQGPAPGDAPRVPILGAATELDPAAQPAE